MSSPLEPDPLVGPILTYGIDNEARGDPGLSLRTMRGVSLVRPPLSVCRGRSWERRGENDLDLRKGKGNSVGLRRTQMLGQWIVFGHGSYRKRCGLTVELSCGPATPTRTNTRYCTGLTASAAQRAARSACGGQRVVRSHGRSRRYNRTRSMRSSWFRAGPDRTKDTGAGARQSKDREGGRRQPPSPLA